MLQRISYQNYYNALSSANWQRLRELHQAPRLPVPAIYIVEIERHGYTVNLTTGEVLLDTGERVLECGHIKNFYSLLDTMIRLQCEPGGVDWAAVRSELGVGDGSGEASGVGHG